MHHGRVNAADGIETVISSATDCGTAAAESACACVLETTHAQENEIENVTVIVTVCEIVNETVSESGSARRAVCPEIPKTLAVVAESETVNENEMGKASDCVM